MFKLISFYNFSADLLKQLGSSAFPHMFETVYEQQDDELQCAGAALGANASSIGVSNKWLV